MVETQPASLTLSGLDLLMKTPDPVGGWTIHALGDDTDLGDPEAVFAKIASQLQDGDLERIDRFGNREATIPLVLEAPDAENLGDALAQAAAALDAACRFDGWTELAYTSSLAGAETSVFEVTSAVVTAKFDDLSELTQGCRYVTLKIHARPWPRTTTAVTIAAPAAVGSTTTSVDSGSATTGWSMLSTAPAPIQNLSTNPSVESNLTGYAASSGTVGISTNPTGGDAGSKSLRAQGNPGKSYVQGPVAAVVAGKTYRVGGSSKSDFLDVNLVGVLTRTYNSGGTQVGTDQESVTGSSTNWKRWKVSRTIPSTATQLRPYPLANYTFDPPFTAQWDYDRAFVIEVTAENPDPDFFDGSSTATAAISYAWDGTANNSTSTGTWTAPTLAVVSGAVRGTVYGRSSASIRRNNTGITAAAMATLSYMRIRGTASAFSDGQVTIADNGGAAITPTSYSYNQTTGAFDILIQRAGGFTNLDVTFTRTGGSVSTTSGIFVAVDQIDITDNPFATGKTQTRQVTIYGSQRTEVSLSVLGLDAAGTTPVGLGEQVLVHTAAAGGDAGAKFLACRQATALAGTADTTAVSGAYNTVNNTTPIASFTITAGSLVTGNYLAVARVRCATVGTLPIGLKAIVGSVGAGTDFSDPPTGNKSAPLVVVASGAVWPQVNQATGSPLSPWVMLPLGLLRLPPADVEDPTATMIIQVFRSGSATNFDIDELFLLNADVGQASIFVASQASGSYSAIRLDAATVDSPQAMGWVGTAGGTMTANPARWVGEQHQAIPGLLQISTVTPGCATSRVSAIYYPRFHTHVASVDA